MKELFQKSEEFGLRYTTYVGDGDSRSFTIIRKLEPYGPDTEITKEECVGHIQKRMGTRLRSLITKSKGNYMQPIHHVALDVMFQDICCSPFSQFLFFTTNLLCRVNIIG